MDGPTHRGAQGGTDSPAEQSSVQLERARRGCVDKERRERNLLARSHGRASSSVPPLGRPSPDLGQIGPPHS